MKWNWYGVWSLDFGILIYYMIKGKYPFDGKRDITILHQIEKEVNSEINDEKDLND